MASTIAGPGAGSNRHITEDQSFNEERKESVATAVEHDSSAANTQPIDKIETVTNDDVEPQENHRSHLTETVKKAAHSARRKVYLHHRHQKDTSTQFKPDSVTKQHKHKDDDPESQIKALHEEEVGSPTRPPSVWQNFWIMLTTFPYWNMAFWSGWCYTIGSALFVVTSAWSWTAHAWPESEFEGETKYGGPLLFFFGACLYQVGGVMAYLEAVNDGSFAGAAMKRLLEGHQDLEKALLDAKLHTFFGHMVPHHHHGDHEEDTEELHHAQSKTDPEAGWNSLINSESRHDNPELVYTETKKQVERRGGMDQGPSASSKAQQGEVSQYLTWRWWPSWHSLRTYHIFEMGYIACAIQLFGVTLYGVTSIVILPGILDSLEWWQALGAYWVPQVVASCCFLIASIMFTLMGQDKWYRPRPGAVSWWIGIWALVGSVGFLMTAVFGLHSEEHTWAEYQSSLSSTWGSFFYMLSGIFQWYEAINVNVGPVLAFPNNRTPVVLRKIKSST